MADLQIHPAAAVWPMMSEEELDALAADIAANGQRAPIVVDSDGRVVDGRNRLEACRRAGMEPDVVTLPPTDPDPDDPDGNQRAAEFILSANLHRRHMVTGARAMATALTLDAAGQRVNGRWKRGAIGNDGSVISGGWAQRMKEAGVVLDEIPGRATAVVTGAETLNTVYEEAQALRRDRTSDEARFKRLPEDLAAQVRDQTLTLGEAVAASKERERHRQKIITDGRDSARTITETLAHALAVVGANQQGADIDPEPLIAALTDAAKALTPEVPQ